MGQGAQTTGQGAAPAWNPTAALQAAAQGQWNPQNAVQPVAAPAGGSDNILSFLVQQMAPQGGVAAPMQLNQAQQQFQNQRDRFFDTPRGSDEREMVRPRFQSARDTYKDMQHGPQLPNPMDRAREYFMAARDQFKPVQEEYRGLEGADRRAFRPEIQEARAEFAPVRDWYRGLQDMAPAEQIGMASMGPPRPTAPPQMAPMMQIPNFPGMAPVSSIADLVAQMQARTAQQTQQISGAGAPGGGGGSAINGGLGPSSSFPKDEARLTDEQRAILQREQDERLLANRTYR